MATRRRRPKGTNESRFHEGWLGMVEQDGLVVSVPVLTAAGLMHQRGAGAQQAYRELLAPKTPDDAKRSESADAEAPPLELPSLDVLLRGLLEFAPADVDAGDDLPEALHVVATESTTNVLLRPTAALRKTPRPGAQTAAPAPLDDDPFDDDYFDDDYFDDDDDDFDENEDDATAGDPDDTDDTDDPFPDDDDSDDDDTDSDDDDDAEPEAESEAPEADPSTADAADTDPELSTAARVGRGYLALVWDLADPDTGFGPAAIGRPFDRPDQDADWSYPPAAKFERLLRHTRVPIGLLTNRRQVRLIYAPHGETAGALTFDLDDMGEVGGRPMLDAFLALLSRDRWLSQAADRRLPALLEASRKQQAEVTERLADQVFDALQALLSGFEAAANRDGGDLLRARVTGGRRSHGTGEVYSGLLTVLLRLVFTLYAEDRGLLPVEHPIYQAGYSVLGLFDELQRDQGAHPDAMDRRFGAWSRLLATWRAIYDGVHHHGHASPDTADTGEEEAVGAQPLHMPPRRGHLFDPDAYPFLEGRPEPGPLDSAAARAAVAVPSVDDGTIFTILDGLLYLREGKARQRLSYRALDVEQIGSVYEALMGYDVVQLRAPAVRLRARRAKGVWLSAADLLAVAPTRRAKWLKEEVGLDKSHGSKLAKAVAKALKEAGLKPTDTSDAAAELTLGVLVDNAGKGYGQRAAAGRLVIQPGDERKRTSSHYTPRELTEPVVRRTLAPILRTMEAKADAPPSSEALLSLKIVDPAMGSGAFLVEVVRQLADHVVAAWQREGRYESQGALLAHSLGGLSPEARPSDGSDDQNDPVILARRLVAQRCVYGVDKNPYAVNLAKLSLWLVTLSKHLPFTFVDHALRCGDSLVGLSLAQARAFDWRVRDDLEFGDGKKAKKSGKGTSGKKAKKGESAPDPLLSEIVAASLQEATDLRRRIVLLANQDGEQAVLEREALLSRARAALDDARLIADLCLGAFFKEAKDKARLAERQRRFDRVMDWLGKRDREKDEAAAAEARAELEALRAEFVGDGDGKGEKEGAGGQSPFHWMLEFPEVFWEGRKDPLAGGKKESVAYFDAVVGNPPFMGVVSWRTSFGESYLPWLQELHPKSHGKHDICAHFFRRAESLLARHGTVGLIATNTISQGDTRTSGLSVLLERGATIYDATVDMRWPAPGAMVTVSILHISFGTTTNTIGTPVLRLGSGAAMRVSNPPVINSHLRGQPERSAPVQLLNNSEYSFIGSYVLGKGFLLSSAEKDELIEADEQNAQIIRTYIGGADINRQPDQCSDRFIVDFGDIELDEAFEWPLILERMKRTVREERKSVKRERYRKYWWRFGERQSNLYTALSRLPWCLAASQVTKHLVWSRQPTSRIFSHTTVVLPVASFSAFSVVQSRGHERWARALGSSMKTDLRYTPSDCFRNFPFPSPDPRTEHPRLEPLGKRLDALRSAFMLDHQVGLTITYNLLLGFDTDAALADPGHKLHSAASDPRLAELRQLHLDLDRAVLDTYAERLAASDDPAERELAPLFSKEAIEVPPYRDPRLPDLTPAERRALETFNDAVLDALMALNEVRAAQERQAAGKAKKPKKK